MKLNKKKTLFVSPNLPTYILKTDLVNKIDVVIDWDIVIFALFYLTLLNFVAIMLNFYVDYLMLIYVIL